MNEYHESTILYRCPITFRELSPVLAFIVDSIRCCIMYFNCNAIHLIVVDASTTKASGGAVTGVEESIDGKSCVGEKMYIWMVLIIYANLTAYILPLFLLLLN